MLLRVLDIDLRDGRGLVNCRKFPVVDLAVNDQNFVYKNVSRSPLAGSR